MSFLTASIVAVLLLVMTLACHWAKRLIAFGPLGRRWLLMRMSLSPVFSPFFLAGEFLGKDITVSLSSTLSFFLAACWNSGGKSLIVVTLKPRS